MRKDFMVVDRPYLHIEQLMLIFGYENRKAFLRAVRSKTLPIPTYRVSNQIVADREVVRRFFAWRRREGIMELNTTISRVLRANERAAEKKKRAYDATRLRSSP